MSLWVDTTVPTSLNDTARTTAAIQNSQSTPWPEKIWSQILKTTTIIRDCCCLLAVIVVFCSASEWRNYNNPRPTDLRILSPAPTIVAKDVVSSIFALSIRIWDVDHVLSERITSDIEHYLSQCAAEAVMARDKAGATILDLACTIRYAKDVNQGNLTRNLRKRHT